MNRLLTAIVILMLLAGLTLPAAGAVSGPADAVRAGNRLYEDGRYREALEAYHQAEDQGERSADLFYNMGNAAYRLGHVGQAVLCYERALWLDPGHVDARFNLDFVQQQLVDKIPEPEDSAVGRFWNWLLARVGVDAVAVTTLVLLVLSAVVGVVFLRRRHTAGRRVWGALAAVILAITLLSGGVFSAMVWRADTLRQGIVVVRELDVRSGPADDNPVLFSVHEGLKVEVNARVRGWVQVVLPNGWNGWVPGKSVTVVQDGL